jgi:hypothetical protein
MRAETIAKALKGHKTGWAACCPAHNDHTPSLSIRYGREGKVLVHCFVGCEQGQVIAALKARGLWVVTVRPKWRQTITRISDHYVAKQLESKITARAEDGLGIWRDSVPAAGTLLAAYLHSRGLDIIAPAALRFHAKLKHPSGTFWPAMVALKQFRTWAPKAVALIGKLPPPLASRAIQIKLRRKTAREEVDPLRADRLGHLEPLARQAARWAADNASALRSAEPAMPKGLFGRAADNWRPLIAIADQAGGEWPGRARRIAEELSSNHSEQMAGIMLLEDMRRIFTDRNEDRLPSKDLAETLSKMEERPWPEWYQGKPITQRQIAKLLEPFGVKPVTIRTTNDTAKGYKLADFGDLFERYLSPVTPSQVSEIKGIGVDGSVTVAHPVTDEREQKSNDDGPCDGVTDPKGSGWGIEL